MVSHNRVRYVWPVILGLAVTCLFAGEIPGKRGALVRAVDSPAAFYVAAVAFVLIAMKMAQVSLVGAWWLYQRSKRLSENLE